ncbi:MAG: NAD(P)H-dependent oxidoreductase [Bacteroidales bacterium]|jgi:nitroreductase/dihydropteridine reductase
MSLIDNLKWRYATKKFDTSKKVSEKDIEFLKDAVNLSASSYGLQPYKVLLIKDEKIREKLREASWGQPQITDSTVIFLFCNYNDVDEKVIDNYIALKSDIQNIPIEQLKGYGDFMKQAIGSVPPEQRAIWASKQTYIGLGTLLAAAAELKVDACPMEGFDKDAYNSILGLKEMGLSASVIATIGYRSEEDETSKMKKVRKSNDDMFINI